jgi:hypothetical protein
MLLPYYDNANDTLISLYLSSIFNRSIGELKSLGMIKPNSIYKVMKNAVNLSITDEIIIEEDEDGEETKTNKFQTS